MPVCVSFPSQQNSGPVLFVLSRSALDSQLWLSYMAQLALHYSEGKFWICPFNGKEEEQRVAPAGFLLLIDDHS